MNIKLTLWGYKMDFNYYNILFKNYNLISVDGNNSTINKISKVDDIPFSIYNKIAITDNNNRIFFLEIDKYWIYPTIDNYLEISPKNSFHSSIIIKNNNTK